MSPPTIDDLINGGDIIELGIIVIWRFGEQMPAVQLVLSNLLD